jgi:hypothetical protein
MTWYQIYLTGALSIPIIYKYSENKNQSTSMSVALILATLSWPITFLLVILYILGLVKMK